MLLSIAITAAAIATHAVGQLDPILNYCARYDHQCTKVASLSRRAHELIPDSRREE